MELKLAKCCGNCEHFLNGRLCTIKEIAVSQNQVCNSYEFKVIHHREDDCLKCSKFQKSDCAHPKAASEGIMCTVWYPRATAS
ncbi:hypothetical protein Ga0061079_10475 [Apibacter mensalis]|jgi:hypothetical protein|uniref:DUF1540 domain-containing protein n=1 Tax=Apibacter mensalis TaxID=1586267 RepID=A0A0X3AP82_9FLAO|nr:hypothetical protein Ga0061079_10475 [Apibacter mensalis]